MEIVSILYDTKEGRAAVANIYARVVKYLDCPLHKKSMYKLSIITTLLVDL